MAQQRESRLRVVESEVLVRRRRGEVFAFCSDPGSLARLSPPWMSVRLLGPSPVAMGERAIVEHRVVTLGVPVSIRSEIEVWEPPTRFVDVQLSGPFRSWRHEHRFSEQGAATLIRERVEYAPPGGALGDLLFARRLVEAIFAHRRRALAEILA